MEVDILGLTLIECVAAFIVFTFTLYFIYKEF